MTAVLELARSHQISPHQWIKSEFIAYEHNIPAKFLEGILRELRRANIVASRRGPEGGYRLAESPDKITVADVIRALDGPLAAVKGQRPEDVIHQSSSLGDVWIALRASMRAVLEEITVSQALDGSFSPQILALINSPGARQRRIH
jgi:Rrf2 family protein